MNAYSISIIAPSAEKEAVNAALALLGYGPQTLTVPLVGDSAPKDGEAPTHYGCHWWADAETVADIDAIRNTTLSGCEVLIRCATSDVIATESAVLESQSSTPEPSGTFGAVMGDFIEIRHKQFSGGLWGWRAEMRSQSGGFEPGVRAIGIYSDAACTQYLYTTGAFIYDAESGRYVTEWNAGDSVKTTRYFALLYASLQEAIGALLDTDDVAVVYLKYGLPPAPPEEGEAWVDTGATVTQLVAAGVYRVSQSLIGTLTAGQAIKLGDAETVFTGFWSGFGDYLLISPHVTAANGSKVWKWA